MKKEVLKVTFLLSVFAIIFSSCLGDGDNKIEVTKDFIYIDRDEYYNNFALPASVGQYCSTSGTPLASLSYGDCAFAGYKIIGNQTGSYPQLQEVNLIKTFSVGDQPNVSIGSMPEGDLEYEIKISSLKVDLWSVGNMIGDRWLFISNCKLADGEKLTAEFYFDESRQKDENGNSLPKNRAIIDIRFKKINPATEEGTNKPYEMVANFTDLRNALKDRIDFENQNVAYYRLKFRYRKIENDGSSYKEETIGTFSESDFSLGYNNPNSK